jgi:predicted RNA binding protein YcfA (HicA-like mRNA interferase family)
MPKLERLSGRDALAVLALFGFKPISQKGSHVKLRRVMPDGSRQTLIVPAHAELDLGTVGAIYRQALRYIPEGDLKPHFYSD